MRTEPVRYSPATARSLAAIRYQLEANLKSFARNNRGERRLRDASMALGQAIALVAIAEEHRQWADHEYFSGLQSQANRIAQETFEQLTGSPV
jgi:hypothetical protein